jgi:hypothetical protein
VNSLILAAFHFLAGESSGCIHAGLQFGVSIRALHFWRANPARRQSIDKN